MKAKVETTIVTWIDVPEGTDRQDVFNFLAEHQSFRDAFVGASDAEQTFRITDVDVIIEEVLEIGEEAFDD
jgi:ribosome maturation protein Sdo1